MNTRIVKPDSTGKTYNSDGQEVIDCKRKCGNLTTMTGTGLCDFCWEKDRKAEDHPNA